MIEAGATSTRKYRGSSIRCARPTGGTHGRTTGTPILLISIRFPLENKEAGVPHGGVVGELRPYDRSRCAEHGEVRNCQLQSVPAPPGVVMFAPPMAPRNAERTQSEGRVYREWLLGPTR